MAKRESSSKKKLPVILWLGVALVVLIVGVVTFEAVKRARGIVNSQDDVPRPPKPWRAARQCFWTPARLPNMTLNTPNSR